MPDTPERRRDDPRFKEINAQLKGLSDDVASILHGNGRAGIRKIADAVFGHRDAPQEPGLMVRVKRIEERDKEAVWLRRGVALGVGSVVLDTVLGLDLSGFVRSVLGGG